MYVPISSYIYTVKKKPLPPDSSECDTEDEIQRYIHVHVHVHCIIVHVYTTTRPLHYLAKIHLVHWVT